MPRVLAVVALGFPAAAFASSWTAVEASLEKASGFGSNAVLPWTEAAAVVVALGAKCEALEVDNEFDRGDCGAKLAGLQKAAREVLTVERTYSARIKVVVGDYDFAASNFPLRSVPTVKMVVYEPGQCDSALIWGGLLGGAPLCFFVSQPRLKAIQGTIWYRGTTPVPARYLVLATAPPVLTTETLAEGVARRVREAVGSSELDAEITFPWRYDSERCTADFEVKGENVKGYCWAEAPPVDVRVLWPTAAARALSQAP